VVTMYWHSLVSVSAPLTNPFHSPCCINIHSSCTGLNAQAQMSSQTHGTNGLSAFSYSNPGSIIGPCAELNRGSPYADGSGICPFGPSLPQGAYFGGGCLVVIYLLVTTEATGNMTNRIRDSNC
jgi:hypothetical protein